MRNNSVNNSSNDLNYQSILQSKFIDFLVSEGASLKTQHNYRSDLHHFMAWILLTTQSRGFSLPQSHSEFMSLLSPEIFTEYKTYLVKNQIPTSTINRRLSTMRSFIRACNAYGWLIGDPTVAITNIVQSKTTTADALLEAWKKDLEQEGASKSTIKNYLTDVRKFLSWSQSAI